MKRLLLRIFLFFMAFVSSGLFLVSLFDFVSHLGFAAKTETLEPYVQNLDDFQPDLAVNTWSEIAVRGGRCDVSAVYKSTDRRSTRGYVYMRSGSVNEYGITIVWGMQISKIDRFRELYGRCPNATLVVGVLDEQGSDIARLRRLFFERTGHTLSGPVYQAEPVMTTMASLRRFKWTQSAIVVLFCLVSAALFSWLFLDQLRGSSGKSEL